MIRPEDVTAVLGKELNAAMTAAAEPILQAALKDIEREMRETLAARLISFIENNIDVNQDGRILRIAIHQAADRGVSR